MVEFRQKQPLGWRTCLHLPVDRHERDGVWYGSNGRRDHYLSQSQNSKGSVVVHRARNSDVCAEDSRHSQDLESTISALASGRDRYEGICISYLAADQIIYILAGRYCHDANAF